MSRRVTARTTVELFPFLAVLVCVMGALIFLLLVMTRQLRATAIADAEAAQQQREPQRADPWLPEFAEKSPPTISEPFREPEVTPPATPRLAATAADSPVKPLSGPDPRESLRERERELAAQRQAQAELDREWQNRVSRLQDQVDAKRTELQRQQLLAKTITTQIQSAQQELLQREAQLAEVMGRLSATDDGVNQSNQERSQLERQILALRKQLKQLVDQQRDASSHYAIVPFEGKSGTTRRPVLIECRATGIRFLPEDVTLTPADLEDFHPQFNPLAAGTLALIEFWSRAENRADGEPYPMLVVRPDGTLAYYMAMKMLSGTKRSFGYELVTDDVKLQVAPLNVEAKAVLEQAIQRVISERDQMASQMAGRGSGIGQMGRGGTNSRSGYPSGPSAGPSAGTTSNSSVTSPAPAGAGYPATARAAGQMGPGAGRNPARQGSPEGTSRGGSNLAASGRSAKSVFSIDDLERENGVGERSWENIDRFEGQQHRRRPGASATDPTLTSIGRSDTPPSSSLAASQTPSSSQQMGNSQPGSGTATAPSASEVAEAPGAVKDNDPNLATDAVRSPTVNAPAATSSTLNSLTGQPSSVDGASSVTSSSMVTRNTTATSQGSDSAGSPSSPSSSSDLDVAQNTSYPNFERNRPRGKSPKNLPYEQLQRRRWGPYEPGATIGLERRVEVRVGDNQLIVGNEFVIPVSTSDSREQVFHDLVNSLDQLAQTWGQPGAGFFWIPSLNFVISPGGNLVYERLSPLVTRSGLASKAEYSLEPARQAVLETQP